MNRVNSETSPQPDAVLGQRRIITDYLKTGQLEAAVLLAKQEQIPLDETIFSPIIIVLAAKIIDAQKNGRVGEFHRLNRLKYALAAFRDYGPVPEKMIMETDLPDGYTGKILMVSISADVMEDMVCLRSGDLWHREILRNTEKEISDLGFYSAKVFPLGGAHLRFDRDGSLLIWGASDDYGVCDVAPALEILAGAFPGKNINVC